jgi:predicted amidohydrolase YtcJ
VFESDTRGNIWPELELFVTRKDDDGKVWGAHERVDRETVLKMITRWAAEYLLREDVLGSLEEGKLADFIVLDRDYLTIPEEAIGDIRVLMTFKGGELMFLDSSVVEEYADLPRDGALVGTLEDF